MHINGNSILLKTMDLFSGFQQDVSFPLSYLGKPVDTIRINNVTNNANDRMAVAKYEMKYPRTFNFGGASVFEFNLPASPVGNYLEISNFASGGKEPVLYDLTSGRRYLGNIAVAGKVRFALPAGGERHFWHGSIQRQSKHEKAWYPRGPGRSHGTCAERHGGAADRAARGGIVGRAALGRLRQPVTRTDCVSGESTRSGGCGRRGANNDNPGHRGVRHTRHTSAFRRSIQTHAGRVTRVKSMCFRH